MLLRFLERGISAPAEYSGRFLRHLRALWKAGAYPAFSGPRPLHGCVVRPLCADRRVDLAAEESRRLGCSGRRGCRARDNHPPLIKSHAVEPSEVAASYDQIAGRWAGTEFDRRNGIMQHERA